MTKLMNPTAKALFPVMIPNGGNIYDALGITIFDTKSQNFYINFAKNLINQRSDVTSGRQKDFLNLMRK